MSASWRLPEVALGAVALIGLIGWMLSRPSGIDGAHVWLAHELPWLARLLDRYLALIGLATLKLR